MQMLSLAAALVAEAVVHFDNGMVGCITKGGKIALVDKAGVSTKSKYMPLVENYLAINSPIMIEHTFRIGKDEYYHETVWVDDEWDFEDKCWDFGSNVVEPSLWLPQGWTAKSAYGKAVALAA